MVRGEILSVEVGQKMWRCLNGGGVKKRLSVKADSLFVCCNNDYFTEATSLLNVASSTKVISPLSPLLIP